MNKSRFKTLPNGLKILTAVVIFIVLIAFAQAFCHTVISQLIMMKSQNLPQPALTWDEKLENQISSHMKKFLPDGTVHLVRSLHSNNEQRYIAYSKEFKELYKGPISEFPYNYINFSSQIYRRFDRSRFQGRLITHAINPALSRTVTIPVVDSEKRVLERWRYSYTRNIFEGFNTKGSRIGYIGQNGLTENLPDAQPFNELCTWNARSYDKLTPSVMLISDYNIYEIDFNTKNTRHLVDTKDGKIRSVSVNPIEKDKTFHADLLVITDSNKFLYRTDTSEKIDIKTDNLPDNLIDYNLSFAITDDKIYLQTIHSDSEPVPQVRVNLEKWKEKRDKEGIQYSQGLYDLNDDGIAKNITTFNWTLPPKVLHDGYNLIRNNYYTYRNHVNSIATPLCSLALNMHYFIRKPYKNEYQPNMLDDFTHVLYEIQPVYLSINTGVALILASIVLVHGLPRRTSNSKLAGWIIFVIMFNLAGFLTYMFLCYTPVIRCHSCGRKRGLESDTCPACGSLLKKPERRETDLLLEELA